MNFDVEIHSPSLAPFCINGSGYLVANNCGGGNNSDRQELCLLRLLNKRPDQCSSEKLITVKDLGVEYLISYPHNAIRVCQEETDVPESSYLRVENRDFEELNRKRVHLDA
ncbi:hypothetical protein Pyn_06743 [Prunus yedoensis var. nudiflora]|uniref:Uncharacterized protein n=1 Tax=Prunus yedoensis var. nudiflora TaxID=2094558 RepID=A0A314Y4F9_PRUYE|nr:hypothetical protein Pyn_06743 [Prunus yedoensis var. nudiflora]